MSGEFCRGYAARVPAGVASKPPRDAGRNFRLIFLSTTLGLMLFALWYEYKIARPSVEAAYESIGQLNERTNHFGRVAPMTNQDVQQALAKQPDYSFSYGPYHVEVYCWTAGLPFHRHEYYAVCIGQGGTMRFLRHYKFHLPTEELDLLPFARTNLASLDADFPTGVESPEKRGWSD